MRPVLTFFNNKGGVGKTSLAYHLSWMLADLGKKMLAVDLDPQANLTAAFLDEERLSDLWEGGDSEAATIYQAVAPLAKVGDLLPVQMAEVGEGLNLIPGDLALAGFEDQLAQEWPNSMNDQNLYRPFRILTAFWCVAQEAADRCEADLIVADVGPNLGAINRSALIGSDYIVIPLGADLFSLQGLQNLGPAFRSWREQWGKRRENWKEPELDLPLGKMKPLGYVVQQHGVRLSRPVKAYDRWVNRIPATYRRSVLDGIEENLLPKDDPHCLAMMKHFRSLIPLAQEARKPIFHLTSADGAIGNHAQAVKDAYLDFRDLARSIMNKMQARAEP